jgi:exodeoxyribonuclease V beta subunit
MEGVEFGAGIPYRAVTPVRERAVSRLAGLRPVELLDVGPVGLVEAAVRKVYEVLTQPHLDTAATSGGGARQRPFRPREVCVLVRTNRYGTAIAKRLQGKHIPAVTEGTASVMAGEMAADIGWLLEAMARPSDQGRARRAAATVFFGEDLAKVASLGEAREEEIQATIQSLHAVLAKDGIAAFAARIMADTAMATRIFGGMGGERRLVDFGHVIELLNDASGGRGCHARVMLEHVAALVAQDETAELVSRRVESDKESVTIMTVHKAKGLQYPCVIVADDWSPEKSARQPVVFHSGGGRVVDIGKTIPNGDTGEDAKTAAMRAANDERRRLIYVAITRPEHHVSILRNAQWRESLLAAVLAHAPDAADAISADVAHAISVRSAADLPAAQTWTDAMEETVLDVARAKRTIEQTYRRTSYSGIAKLAGRVETGADAPEGPGYDEDAFVATVAGAPAVTDGNEPEPSAPPLDLDDDDASAVPASELRGFLVQSLPAGTAFGRVAHTIFERIITGPDVSEDLLRDEVERVVNDVATARFLVDHRTNFSAMIADAMLTPFGGPADAVFRDLRFADFGPADRLAELDFEMALAGLDKRVKARHVGNVLATVLEAGHPLAAYAERLSGRAFDVPLAGLINGSIDAVLRIPGRPADDPRLVIADYKTNRLHGPDAEIPLADYAPSKLVAAMGEHHYPLQALVYGTAVWRMLRWRLGPRKPADWEPGECLAGIVYAFVRGMKGPTTPVDAAGGRYGVFTWLPPVTIWRRLSDLFAGDRPEENA